MPTPMSILNRADRKTFESPPVFTEDERTLYFKLPQWATDFLNTLRTPNSKTGFVLQMGYFRAANKFFSSEKFHQSDAEFVARALGFRKKQIQLKRYKGTTHERHKILILEKAGFRKFDNKVRTLVEKEAEALGGKQMHPRSIFMSLVDFLRSKKIEVPSYHALSAAVTRAVQAIERDLYTKITKQLTADHKQLLDGLLEKSDDYLSDDKRNLKVKRYKITLLKKSSQSTRPSKIRENVTDLDCLKDIFDNLYPVIKALGLSPETIQFYARIVVKSQVFQLARRDDKKYLYLLAFVIHQYYRLNDLLGDALLQCVQTAVNTASREHKEQIFRDRITKQLTLKKLLRKLNSHLAKIKEVERIINAENLSDTKKVQSIKSLLESQNEREQIEKQMGTME